MGPLFLSVLFLFSASVSFLSPFLIELKLLDIRHLDIIPQVTEALILSLIRIAHLSLCKAACMCALCTRVHLSLGQQPGANKETQARLLAGEWLQAVSHLLCNHVCPPVFNR